LNKVVNVLHSCADRWDGSANKTDGDSFLLTWLLPNSDN
jgi:class 3 adenylate cyclase